MNLAATPPVPSRGKVVNASPLPPALAAVKAATGEEARRWESIFEHDYNGEVNYIGRAHGANLAVPAPYEFGPQARRFTDLQHALENAVSMARAEGGMSYVVKQTSRGAHMVLPAVFADYVTGRPTIDGALDLDPGTRVRIAENGIEAVVGNDSIALFS